MATKLKPANSTGTDADVDEYLGLLSELDVALREERAAHKRLMALAAEVEVGSKRLRQAFPDLFAQVPAGEFALWLLETAGGQAIKERLSRRGLQAQVYDRCTRRSRIVSTSEKSWRASLAWFAK